MRKWLLVPMAGLLTGLPVFGQVTLTHKFNEGEKIAYTTKLQMKQKLTIGGNDIATANEQTVEVGMAVGKRGKDGTLPVDCGITRLRTKLSLPGDITIEFDSKKPGEDPDNPNLGPVMEALRASARLKYRQVYDKNNRVVAVTGSESILATLKPTVAAMLKDQIDSEYLKQAANQELDQIPAKPIKKGDKWQRTKKLRLGSGQIMEIDSEYEYLGTVQHKGKILHKIVSVSKEVRYEQDPAAAAHFKVMSSDLGIETKEGTIFFDQKAGRVCESYHRLRITGALQMQIQGKENPCELDLTIAADTIVE